MMPDRWEMGSEFHWDQAWASVARKGEGVPGSVFASGRAAIAALADSTGWRGRTIHLPSYFCPDVTAALAQVFDIRWYMDRPTDSAPDFDSIRVENGDIVLAVNYFGVRPDGVWGHWISQHPDCVVIEDLSHDPAPSRMIQSPAHYVVASLRKTMPLPDGAVVMSPRGLDVSPSPAPVGGSLKLEAMTLKAMYLQGLPVDKDAFRQLQIDGEELIGSQIPPSVFTMAILDTLDLPGLRWRKADNVRYLVESEVLRTRSRSFEPLFAAWPSDATPFNVVLHCQDQTVRDSLRQHLIQHEVYPAVHWVQEGRYTSDDELSRELGDRLLTLPTDFRYDRSDMDRLLSILETFQA